MKLAGRKIILGVTGGIAAYKSAYLTRLMIKAGAEVQVIMTDAGTKFVAPLTFEALTTREVAVEMFPDGKFVGTRHITYADWPDLIIIAPATADFIAQIANGFCPSLLAAVVCATRRPIIVAPAMNDGMYTNAAVQQNIKKLKDMGCILSDVGIGDMACHSWGPGRMAEPEELFELICRQLEISGPLNGKKVLVTAGPCREALDPVRYISNRSSGKMGYAMAAQAMRLGGEVTLVSGPTTLPDPAGIRVIKVETTSEMADAVGKEFSNADYLIMAAAPADYMPKIKFDQKIKKCTDGMMVELAPTIDILKKITPGKNKDQIVVGFSLETENELENSRKKLYDKNLDYIVINNPLRDGAGFDTDTNEVTILGTSGDPVTLARDDKEIVARKIWEHIIK